VIETGTRLKSMSLLRAQVFRLRSHFFLTQ
jgi:hypothetical protein